MSEFQLNIKFDDESKETAEVWVDGKLNSNSTSFIFDTGCAHTSIPFNDFSSSLKSLGLRDSSGALGKATYELVSIDSLEIGPIQKTDWMVSRARPDELDRNLLGMDILKDYCLQFHFAQNKVKIISHVDETFKEDLILDKGSIPYVEVTCGTTIARAVWDSGAGITLVDLEFLKQNSSLFKKLGSTTGTDSTGSTQETPLYEMQPVQIGGRLFPAHPVVAVNLSHINSQVEIPMDFILGYSTLSKASWVFDFPRRKWGFLDT
jgi:hypothetical protein